MLTTKLNAYLTPLLEKYKIHTSGYAIINHHKITPHQCLNMTSGLCYGDLNSSFPDHTQNQTLPSLKNILNGIFPAHNLPIKSIYPAGSRYAYSGPRYMVL